MKYIKRPWEVAAYDNYFYVGEVGAKVQLAAWRRKAPSGSATKLDGDTILVGSGSNPDTSNNLSGVCYNL